jgi:hypothetical protein
MTLRGILRATTAILFLVGKAAGGQSPRLNFRGHLDLGSGWLRGGIADRMRTEFLRRIGLGHIIAPPTIPASSRARNCW